MWNRIKAFAIATRDWLDCKLVPSWRIWYKQASMQLGLVFAAIVSFLTAAPSVLQDTLNALPDWMRSSLPAWIGPGTLAILFVARFWDQRKGKPDDGQQ